MATGSWSLAEELFNRGDPAFVEELRRVHFAERLGEFAGRWFADKRPFARKALFDYLSRPFNCYRHEALVKRLFKLAETAGDDELMGAFLVAFDRTIRRERRTQTQYKQGEFKSQAAAEAAIRSWEAEGFGNPTVNTWSGRTYAYASKNEPTVVMPGNTVMPRPPKNEWKRNDPIPDAVRQKFEKRFTLFSLPTRRYLRRRAWRYFRRIGKTDPARYLKAATAFLPRYTDADTDSDIHLLDNWGLMHVLFHNSRALAHPAKGWEFAPGRSIVHLAPAPRFGDAWRANPQAVFDVLLAANCRTVRQWAIWMMRAHHEAWLRSQPVTTLLRLADHSDPDLAAFGFELVEQAPDLATVPVEEWLKRLDGDDLEKLTRLSDLLIRKLDPDRVKPADALRLAGYRSKPVAELGFAILKRKVFWGEDSSALLDLVQAESEAIRPDLMRWLRGVLESFAPARLKWVLEFLDSKHEDVRAAGWAWLKESPLQDDPTIWHHLIESPYDDIRGPLIEQLKSRAAGADPNSVRLLWATVLLNVAGVGRHKPGVVHQVTARLAQHPDETDQLLPLLAVAVRSLRGPEFRAGLAGVVWLIENKPELLLAIRQRFPELEM